MILHNTRRDLIKFCLCSNAKYLGCVESVYQIPPYSKTSKLGRIYCSQDSVLTCMLPEACPSVHLRTQPGNQATVPLFRTLQTLVYGVPGGTLSPSPTVMSWGIECGLFGEGSQILSEKESFLTSDWWKFGTLPRKYRTL